MKIAVLSDIHANSIALDGVLNDMLDFNIEHIFVLGDLVGYYYHPLEVINKLRSLKNVSFILGNHDKMLLDVLCGKQNIEEITTKYGSGVKIALSEISEKELKFISDFPEKMEINIGGTSFLLCHGSPFNPEEYVYPDASEESIDRFADLSYDYILMGHTHYPFHSKRGGVNLVNPGSVGQPRDIGNLSSYTIIDDTTNEVLNRRIPFAIESLVAEVRLNDPSNNYLHEILKRNQRSIPDAHSL
ncbi:MAG: transporter [Planctomycetota bacterium]|nr:MAG: transporter [Planctomycetota bacterium]